MKYNIQEKIEATISLKEVEELISKKVEEDGYTLVSITPDYKTEYSYHNDPRTFNTPSSSKLIGFKANLQRKKD